MPWIEVIKGKLAIECDEDLALKLNQLIERSPFADVEEAIALCLHEEKVIAGKHVKGTERRITLPEEEEACPKGELLGFAHLHPPHLRPEASDIDLVGFIESTMFERPLNIVIGGGLARVYTLKALPDAKQFRLWAKAIEKEGRLPPNEYERILEEFFHPVVEVKRF